MIPIEVGGMMRDIDVIKGSYRLERGRTYTLEV